MRVSFLHGLDPPRRPRNAPVRPFPPLVAQVAADDELRRYRANQAGARWLDADRVARQAAERGLMLFVRSGFLPSDCFRSSSLLESSCKKTSFFNWPKNWPNLFICRCFWLLTKSEKEAVFAGESIICCCLLEVRLARLKSAIFDVWVRIPPPLPVRL